MALPTASDNPFPSLLVTEGTAPSSPAAGKQRVYIDSTTHRLTRKTSAGTVVDIETAAAGAPSTAKYLTGDLDGTLSAEKVKAALYRNYDPDEYPTSGLTLSDEFDDSSLDVAWSWDTSPGGTVSESTYPGFLYLTGGTDSSGTVRLLRRTFAPGGSTAFSVAAKLNLAIENGNYNSRLGVRVVDSSDATIWAVDVLGDGTTTASDGYRIVSTASTWITAATVPLIMAPQYVLFTRDASNVYKGYASANGIVWQYLGTTTTATTVAKVCIAYGVDTDALDDDASVDFVRVFNTVTKKIGA